jgi:tRNA pseudouridine55 synthase
MKRTEFDNLPGGVLAVHKAEGMTSHDVVNRVRRLYNTRRVGHAGTLDPLATGVLIVLVGRAAKACEYISSDTKCYDATLRLGMTTDTEDVTGEILRQSDYIPDVETVYDACRKFTGKIMQTPPMYSALKVDGQKLYDLARRGVVIERQKREIEISRLDCHAVEGSNTDYALSVRCSGGTYIRTLCADIGEALGCGGVMATLCRTEACGISLCEAHTLDEIENMSEDERERLLMPVERLFSELDRVNLPAFFEKLFRSGCPIYQKKMGTAIEQGKRVRVCRADGSFFALGEVIDTPDGSAIKSIKTFELE